MRVELLAASAALAASLNNGVGFLPELGFNSCQSQQPCPARALPGSLSHTPLLARVTLQGMPFTRT